MTDVDSFTQFLCEELAKEGQGSLVLSGPPDASRAWIVRVVDTEDDPEGRGDDLPSALNHVSKALDFTWRDIPIYEPTSGMIYLIASRTTLTLTAPRDSVFWCVEVGDRTFEAVSLRDALVAAANYLMGEE